MFFLTLTQSIENSKIPNTLLLIPSIILLAQNAFGCYLWPLPPISYKIKDFRQEVLASSSRFYKITCCFYLCLQVCGMLAAVFESRENVLFLPHVQSALLPGVLKLKELKVVPKAALPRADRSRPPNRSLAARRPCR